MCLGLGVLHYVTSSERGGGGGGSRGGGVSNVSQHAGVGDDRSSRSCSYGKLAARRTLFWLLCVSSNRPAETPLVVVSHGSIQTLAMLRFGGNSGSKTAEYILPSG